MSTESAATNPGPRSGSPEATKQRPDVALVADSVVRRFGGLVAVDVDHLEIAGDAITALVGPNGAGKTTFFNLLTGFDRPDDGRILFEGSDITRQPAHTRARAGLVRTFQLTRVFSHLSVRQNLILGAQHQTGESLLRGLGWAWREQEDALAERVDELLDRFGLTRVADDYAASLSGGQRKLLELSRALMTDPKMVLMDEPMAGVNPALTESLLGHIKTLPADGIGVVFVEHDMDAVVHVADRAVVMAEGRILADGTPDDALSDPEVVAAYLGGHHNDRSDFESGPVPIANSSGAVGSALALQRARDAYPVIESDAGNDQEPRDD